MGITWLLQTNGRRKSLCWNSCCVGWLVGASLHKKRLTQSYVLLIISMRPCRRGRTLVTLCTSTMRDVCFCCGGAQSGKHSVLSAVSRLLNRLATISSEVCWACASPAMAYLSLWLVVHTLGLTAMLVAFDESAFTTARAATIVGHGEGE